MCAVRGNLVDVAGDDPRLNKRDYRRLRVLVLERDRHECQIKGPTCTRYATVVDHIIARADGGDFWNPNNLRAACRACNGVGGAEIANRRIANRYEYETRW